MRIAAVIVLGIVLMTQASCMHLRGVVEEAPGRPATTAALSIGRPGGISTVTEYHVDTKGRFDFWISALDEHRVYLFDLEGDPQTTMRRVDRSEFSDQMLLTIPSGHRRGNLINEMP